MLCGSTDPEFCIWLLLRITVFVIFFGKSCWEEFEFVSLIVAEITFL